jgi:hypothetical protein
MKIKDITISIFAIIGFVAILSSFNNQTHDTVPESHIWEFHIANNASDPSFAINKVTGEVRKYNYSPLDIDKNGVLNSSSDDKYAIMKEAK